MPKLCTIIPCLLLLLSPASAIEPSPAPSQRFAMPLTDGTTTQAVFLAAPKNNLHLIYASKTGQLLWWHVSQTDPDPDPVPPPPPPPVKLLHIAVIHDPGTSTVMQRQVMADPAWRAALPPPHKFAGIIPSGLIDPNTGTVPAAQAPFLKAAKNHTLPCLVFLNENFAIFAVVPLPDSAAAILTLIKSYTRTKNDNSHNRREQLQSSDPRETRPLKTSRRRKTLGMFRKTIRLRESTPYSQGN